MFRIDIFEEEIPALLLKQLSVFEQQFHYPLSASSSFSIKHPGPYTTFTKALGKSAHLIAHSKTQLLAVMSIAIRDLSVNGKTSRCAYICDLKIDPHNRFPFLLARLLKQAQTYTLQQCSAAYAVVMHGSSRNPEQYTGRLGIPAFSKHSALEIASVPAVPCAPLAQVRVEPLRDETFLALVAHAAQAVHIHSNSAALSLRSLCTAQLITIDDNNFAVFEDTRAAKQLFNQSGVEIRNAHLSHLHCTHAQHAQTLLATAQTLAAHHDFERLFFCINANQKSFISPTIRQCAQISRAQVYAFQLPTDITIPIHSSEI